MTNSILVLIKRLREATGYSPADCKQALEASNGNLEMARQLLKIKYASKYVDEEKEGSAQGETQ